MMRGRHATLLPLLVALLALGSALLVVQFKHRSRALTIELANLREEHDQLGVEWAQLQLEEATLAQHSRVEDISRSQLQMVDPPDTAIVSGAP